MHYLIWATMVYGATIILVFGAVFSPIKWKMKEYIDTEKSRGFFLDRLIVPLFTTILKIVVCPMCTSFWVGLLVGLCPGYSITGTPFFDGILGSGSVQLIMNLTHPAGSNQKEGAGE